LNEENADLRGLVERNEVELREGRENLERIEREFRRVEAELRGIAMPEPMPHRPQHSQQVSSTSDFLFFSLLLRLA
jgi:hypothetical protein